MITTTAIYVKDSEGRWYARCNSCKWRGAPYDGPLAEIDAYEDAEEHDGHKHVP